MTNGPITCWSSKKQDTVEKKIIMLFLSFLIIPINRFDYLKEKYCMNAARYGVYFNKEQIPHRYLGITQHPQTKNYIIVIEFLQNRDF
ncbi:617_t:CDS:2 [Gigaspora margarita]|uniref:617_t:CDS:1 n=1 Tax=Gigaspora margarita TaxID=4874 RepID=A0ABN7VN64_GIGMA|nr:617_t:CDS:2 [Gigaspora margarita]